MYLAASCLLLATAKASYNDSQEESTLSSFNDSFGAGWDANGFTLRKEATAVETAPAKGDTLPMAFDPPESTLRCVRGACVTPSARPA